MNASAYSAIETLRNDRREPGRAEVAFSVGDDHQGQGIASAVIHRLTALARAAALREFYAEVLPENAPMLAVFSRCGLPMRRTR